jgi:cytidylate kinase
MNMSPSISYDILSKQNAETSTALIAHYESNKDFNALSAKEGADILARDQEDAEKLQVGIDYAKEKGVIDPDFVPEEYIAIDVLGKTPAQVADEMLSEMGKKEGESVIVICGLSGTGKGTTVSKLMEKIEGDGNGRSVVCWSNGNVFRSVTLLAATWCEQQDGLDGFDADKALTKENLASFMSMLEFGKVSFWRVAVGS